MTQPGSTDQETSLAIRRGYLLARLHRLIDSIPQLTSALVPDATGHPIRLHVKYRGSGVVFQVRARRDHEGKWVYVDPNGGVLAEADDPNIAVWELRARLAGRDS